MKQSSSSNNQSQDSSSSQSSSNTNSNSGKSSKTILYVAIALIAVAVIIVILAVAYYANNPSTSVTIPVKSANSTSVYMSTADAQKILDQQISSYNTSDIFNPYSEINATFMISLDPQLYGNLTSGWVTIASGNNSNTNTTIFYVVMTVNNTATVAHSLGSAMSYLTNGTTPVTISPGEIDGLNYTYGSYTNSSIGLQTLYGYKNNDAAFVFVEENPGYTVNQTTLINTVAKVTP